MARKRIIAIGAIARDVILTVPHFPVEDSKLRATSCTSRRGGNVGNTLEVLQRILSVDTHLAISGSSSDGRALPHDGDLLLIAALPSKTSPQTQSIALSFGRHLYAPARTGSSGRCMPAVDLQYCLHREDCLDPMTAYIISSASTSSRTIVNHNPIPEMTFDEFVWITDRIVNTAKASEETIDELWFHFEGRNPETTAQCMRYIRWHLARSGSPGTEQYWISVELEKPGRAGLQELTQYADVVFYSRSWAEGTGYTSASDCLLQQAIALGAPALESVPAPHDHDRLLVCTWGSDGACSLFVNKPSSTTNATPSIVRSPAHISDEPIVDSTGAGDTFIAAMLYAVVYRGLLESDSHGSWSQEQALEFANKLAGNKILQDGFQGLAAVAEDLLAAD